MSNALIHDLVQARLRERDEIVASKNAAILSRLNVEPMPSFDMSAEEAASRLTPYLTYCQTAVQYPLSPVPATPALVAYFVQEATLPVDEIVSILEVISRLHNENNFADPATSYLVTAAMSKKAKIDPPRSWRKDTWPLFGSLPYLAQRQVRFRDDQATAELKRAQNAEHKAKKELAETKEAKRETEAA